jgi:hypothetical protein
MPPVGPAPDYPKSAGKFWPYSTTLFDFIRRWDWVNGVCDVALADGSTAASDRPSQILLPDQL